MPPIFAILLWLLLLLVLLLWDSARQPKACFWTWVPVLWLFITASRLPSQWLGGEVAQSAEALENGNPLDRTLLFVLILAALVILFCRSFPWGRFAANNIALLAFLAYALLSFTWSDFPLIALKRWFRDLGGCFILLVALSDKLPADAGVAVLRRLAYLLIPLSILICRYFPEIGKQYDPWTGTGYYTGCATSKNMLGLACLVSGLFFFWDTVKRWSDRRQRRNRHILAVKAVFLAMTVYLLHLAKSATSSVCLMLGCLLIAAAHSQFFRRHPRLLNWMVPVCFGLYLFLAFGLGLSGEFAGAVGRDPTLTDRTNIWAFVLRMQPNPLLGTGYESFWLGQRLDWFWTQSGLGRINEAHNGYLEVYLNLGSLGLFFLGCLLAATYRNICRGVKQGNSIGFLALAFWTVLLFYSMTEAGFRSGLLWTTFLLVALPLSGNRRTRAVICASPASQAGSGRKLSAAQLRAEPCSGRL
jgi:O-antigen ligase